jgi:UDP-galactopyranose mutase
MDLEEARKMVFPSRPDLLIVGAGPTGCVIAERAATLRGWSSVIVEKRAHIGGNCFDRQHQSGVMIHEYGPHYFRTDHRHILDYLSQFTEWIPGNYVAKSSVNGALLQFPINLTTLESFFGRRFESSESAEQFLAQRRLPIPHPANSEEFVLSRVGRELYEAFYLGYTLKQWGRHPRDLAPEVCGRIPVRLNRDERYVEQKFQLTPKHGFTELFRRMISNPLIQVMQNTDYREVTGAITPRQATVYCGPLDEYFDHRLGRLPWRSLRFEFKEFDREFVQPCVQINYPDQRPYTRSVEIKHVTKQKHAKTVVSYEYPSDEGDPYYPVLDASSQALHRRYLELADNEWRLKRVLLSGRLGRYKYINMDEAVGSAFEAFHQIEKSEASLVASL